MEISFKDCINAMPGTYLKAKYERYSLYIKLKQNYVGFELKQLLEDLSNENVTFSTVQGIINGTILTRPQFLDSYDRLTGSMYPGDLKLLEKIEFDEETMNWWDSLTTC